MAFLAELRRTVHESTTPRPMFLFVLFFFFFFRQREMCTYSLPSIVFCAVRFRRLAVQVEYGSSLQRLALSV